MTEVVAIPLLISESGQTSVSRLTMPGSSPTSVLTSCTISRSLFLSVAFPVLFSMLSYRRDVLTRIEIRSDQEQSQVPIMVPTRVTEVATRCPPGSRWVDQRQNSAPSKSPNGGTGSRPRMANAVLRGQAKKYAEKKPARARAGPSHPYLSKPACDPRSWNNPVDHLTQAKTQPPPRFLYGALPHAFQVIPRHYPVP